MIDEEEEMEHEPGLAKVIYEVFNAYTQTPFALPFKVDFV